MGAREQIDQQRALLDAFGEPHPAFELGLRWLDEHVPPDATRPALVHGDFRNGNFIVGPDGIRAVLDWELAHLGDPIEDLGWLCVKSWRFGNADRLVGGFGALDELLAAYADAGGAAVDEDALRFWVVLGTVKWGVICVGPGVHAPQRPRAIGRARRARAPGRRDGMGPARPARRRLVNDAGPTDAAELVAAVREFLERDVMAATEGRVQFHTRVAVNVLSMVERELDARRRPRAGGASARRGAARPRRRRRRARARARGRASATARSTTGSTRCAPTCARPCARSS